MCVTLCGACRSVGVHFLLAAAGCAVPAPGSPTWLHVSRAEVTAPLWATIRACNAPSRLQLRASMFPASGQQPPRWKVPATALPAHYYTNLATRLFWMVQDAKVSYKARHFAGSAWAKHEILIMLCCPDFKALHVFRSFCRLQAADYRSSWPSASVHPLADSRKLCSRFTLTHLQSAHPHAYACATIVCEIARNPPRLLRHCLLIFANQHYVGRLNWQHSRPASAAHDASNKLTGTSADDRQCRWQPHDLRHGASRRSVWATGRLRRMRRSSSAMRAMMRCSRLRSRHGSWTCGSRQPSPSRSWALGVASSWTCRRTAMSSTGTR